MSARVSLTCFEQSYQRTVSMRAHYSRKSYRALSSIINYTSKIDDLALDHLKGGKFRKHPGKVRPGKSIILPPVLQQSVSNLIDGYPIKEIIRDGDNLASKLWHRHRPPEKKDLARKRAEIENRMIDQLREEGDKDNLLGKKITKMVDQILLNQTQPWRPINYDQHTGLMFMTARMPAIYSAVYSCLFEIRNLLPNFSPKTLLDFGSGIGSVVWAVNDIWGQHMKEYLCVDASAHMNNISRWLIKNGSKDPDETTELIRGVSHRQFLPVGNKRKYDLVVSAYSLLDLASAKDRNQVVQSLWQKTDKFLVIIESGTREGYLTVMEARDYILKRSKTDTLNEDVAEDEFNFSPRFPNGHVFAPCPHQLTCPKLATNKIIPCNFETSYHPLYYTTGGSQINIERYTYLIMRKGWQSHNAKWPRLVDKVLTRSKHVVCRLCCSDGQLQQATITKAKHGRELYRCARVSNWGDLLPVSSSPSETDS